MDEELSQPFTKEKVREAMFDFNPSKAPGPDGFMTVFFQDAWDVIGNFFTSAALEVLNNEGSLKEWNKTVITLIPKTKEPTSIKDFQPISLYNVSYKIIARTITN